MTTKDVYVLEVVAKNQENLATGRFLVAESSGKDAADILIILVLYELAKIDPKMRIVLVTNDHYGKTLQPIYKCLGANIEVIGKISSEIISQMGN